MRNILGAIASASVVDIVCKTSMVSNIIDQAANRAENIADFLDKLTEGLQEESDDLSMQ